MKVSCSKKDVFITITALLILQSINLYHISSNFGIFSRVEIPAILYETDSYPFLNQLTNIKFFGSNPIMIYEAFSSSYPAFILSSYLFSPIYHLLGYTWFFFFYQFFTLSIIFFLMYKVLGKLGAIAGDQPTAPATDRRDCSEASYEEFFTIKDNLHWQA